MRTPTRFLGAVALTAALTATGVSAQDALVIRGGTVHPISDDPFVGTVVIENGRIADVGPNAEAPAGAEVIDAAGLHVYPGMFDAVSRLGLTEIGAVDVTSDDSELGDYTPHLQARTAVHPASEHIPVARANGITHTMAVPGGNGAGFPGQGSIFHLAGWTIEEMEIEAGAAMVMNWPSLQTREFDWQTRTVRQRPYREAREEYDRAIVEVERWLEAARDYDRSVSGGAPVDRDLRLEALARVASGELPVVVNAYSERQIRDAVEFADEHGLRLVIAGAGEGHEVADLLADRGVPVILGPTQSMPNGPDSPYDEAYANPGRLHEAGVKIAIATFNSSSSRTLPYEAGMAVPYGLPPEAALRAITINPAEILGVDDRLGTIEPGKIANLIVTDGDPLEITTRLQHLIIEGRETSTMNKHRELYERYRSRPVTATSSTMP